MIQSLLLTTSPTWQGYCTWNMYFVVVVVGAACHLCRRQWNNNNLWVLQVCRLVVEQGLLGEWLLITIVWYLALSFDNWKISSLLSIPVKLLDTGLIQIRRDLCKLKHQMVNDWHHWKIRARKGLDTSSGGALFWEAEWKLVIAFWLHLHSGSLCRENHAL